MRGQVRKVSHRIALNPRLIDVLNFCAVDSTGSAVPSNRVEIVLEKFSTYDSTIGKSTYFMSTLYLKLTFKMFYTKLCSKCRLIPFDICCALRCFQIFPVITTKITEKSYFWQLFRHNLFSECLCL